MIHRGVGAISEGGPADIVLLDPQTEWTVESARFASKGKNTPLDGVTLRGAAVTTIADGRVVHETEVPVG